MNKKVCLESISEMLNKQKPTSNYNFVTEALNSADNFRFDHKEAETMARSQL